MDIIWILAFVFSLNGEPVHEPQGLSAHDTQEECSEEGAAVMERMRPNALKFMDSYGADRLTLLCVPVQQ